MKELDERKAIGSEGVSGYILKECRQEMSESIYEIVCDLLKQEKSIKNLKERIYLKTVISRVVPAVMMKIFLSLKMIKVFVIEP